MAHHHNYNHNPPRYVLLPRRHYSMKFAPTFNSRMRTATAPTTTQLALPELLLAALAMEMSTPPLVLVLIFRNIKGKEVCFKSVGPLVHRNVVESRESSVERRTSNVERRTSNVERRLRGMFT